MHVYRCYILYTKYNSSLLCNVEITNNNIDIKPMRKLLLQCRSYVWLSVLVSICLPMLYCFINECHQQTCFLVLSWCHLVLQSFFVQCLVWGLPSGVPVSQCPSFYILYQCCPTNGIKSCCHGFKFFLYPSKLYKEVAQLMVYNI